MRRGLRGFGLFVGLLALGGCEAGQQSAPGSQTVADSAAAEPFTEPEESHLWMTIGEHRFAISLADTVAARALSTLLPLTLDMAELNGNEKHAELPKALSTSSSRPRTIRAGDVMLYGNRTLVVFYATFKSSYAYTRIGRVENHARLARALGPGGARVTLSAD